MNYDLDTAIDRMLETSKEYMMNATQAVTDGKLEPVVKTEATQPLVVTGQGLYDTFMVSDKSEITRMDYIRSLVDKADADQIKGACDNLVKKARDVDYPAGKGKGDARGPKEQQAMNVRTLVQQAWGALKHARTALDASGYTDETGYQAMRVLAKRALDESGKTWQGYAVPTAADKAAKALAREQKAEKDILVDVMKQMPRMPNESLLAYNTRVAQAAESAVNVAHENAEANFAKELATSILEKQGEGRAYRVAMALLDLLDIEHVPSEVTEEEANAALAAEEEQAA